MANQGDVITLMDLEKTLKNMDPETRLKMIMDASPTS